MKSGFLFSALSSGSDTDSFSPLVCVYVIAENGGFPTVSIALLITRLERGNLKGRMRVRLHWINMGYGYFESDNQFV